MDIYFTYETGTCNQFKKTSDSKEETVTIVVSPLRVEGTGTEKLKVISGCNMWQGCKNGDCFYSSAAREKPKLKPKSQKK